MPKATKKKRKVGRPRLKSKKKRYQVMLDPSYAEHFAGFAQSQNMQLQDLYRIALFAVVPDPYHAPLTSSDGITALREKALAYAAGKFGAKNPLTGG